MRTPAPDRGPGGRGRPSAHRLQLHRERHRRRSGVSLITEGTLTVCTNPPYEPFEFEQDGKVVGLDMDIVNEVAKDLGVELAIKVTPFEGIQSGEDLNSSNCDIVASGITINDVRESKMDFSEPYFDADQGLLVPAGSGLASARGPRGASPSVCRRRRPG